MPMPLVKKLLAATLVVALSAPAAALAMPGQALLAQSGAPLGGALPPKQVEVARGAATPAAKKKATSTAEERPALESVLNPDAARPAKAHASLNATHKANLSSKDLAFSARFASHVSAETPALIAVQGDTLTYWQSAEKVAVLKNVQLLSQDELEPFGVKQPVLPVQLLGDGTTQLLVWRSVKTTRGDTLYKITLYQVVGRYFSKAFDQTLARRDKDASQLTHVARFEVSPGKKVAALSITPLDDKGKLLTQQRQRFEWNPWEAMFRVPAPVHTAPKRNQS